MSSIWKAVWKLFSARWQTYLALAAAALEAYVADEGNNLTLDAYRDRACKWIQSHKKWPGTLRGIACDWVRDLDAEDVRDLIDKLQEVAATGKLPAPRPAR